MTIIDVSVSVLAQQGHTAEEIADLLASSLGRLVRARCRSDVAKLEMARRAMETMKGAMR